MSQKTNVVYSPINGMRLDQRDVYWTAGEFRRPKEFWSFNPWTGTRRAQSDIGSDPHGLLIRPDGESMLAAPKFDMVNHPSHYTQGKVECIDALEAATAGLNGIEAVCTAAAIKYLWRWKFKGGREDLRKARWYINRLLGDAS